MNFNTIDYNVSVWDRIKDITPGMEGKKDTNLPLIDNIDTRESTKYFPMSHEEMEKAIHNHHFPYG